MRRQWTLAVVAVLLVAGAGLTGIAALEVAAKQLPGFSATWIARTQLVLMAMTVLAIAFAAVLALEAKEVLARHARDARAAIDVAARALAARQEVFALLRDDVQARLHTIATHTDHLLAMPNANHHVVRIQNSTHALVRSISHLLELANFESGHTRLRREWTDANELVGDVLARCSTLATAKGAHLDPLTTPAPLYVDRDRIADALAALCADALAQAQIGARITLAARQYGDQVRFDICDATTTTASLPDKRRKQPHGPSHATDPATLLLCQRIVEAHGGKLGLDRNGSQFLRWCVLPSTAPQPHPATPALPQ